MLHVLHMSAFAYTIYIFIYTFVSFKQHQYTIVFIYSKLHNFQFQSTKFAYSS